MFFQKSRRLWDSVEKYRIFGQTTDDNMKRRMRFEFWRTNATDTHSVYVILIVFRRQHWLLERASILRYMYIAFIVTYEAWNAQRTMLRPYLIIRGFYIGENSYSDVFWCSASLVSGVSAFRADALPLPCGWKWRWCHFKIQSVMYHTTRCHVLDHSMNLHRRENREYLGLSLQKQTNKSYCIHVNSLVF